MKKSLLFAAGAALVAMPMSAQKLAAGYVTWPQSQQLHTYVSQWNGGSGTITVDGKTWEDANFFISRVKPKERFYDNASQVYPSITQYDASTKEGNDKRVAFWVPVGEESRNMVKLNALADGVFDGEVFNMWSYIDHWGNWNAPFGWTPGNFADVAHKNGVAVSGVCGVPFGSLGNWQTTFTSLKNLGGTTVGKFLYYFGQDGLGYNSEWGSTGGGAKGLGLTTFHEQLQTYMADKNPIWEVLWYGGVTDTGGNAFDSGLSSSQTLYKSASMFLNYNWNNGTLPGAISTSKNMSKSPFYLYSGMNVQGGEPKSGSNYDILKDYQASIGLWGAHAVNMYWQGRYSNGSSDAAKMNTYLKTIEQWFGNGPRNPAIKLTPTLNRTHRPHDTWAGMSSMMSARSVLNWDLTKEPFYTFFNIGNGSFFNWKGQRTHNNPWHNIGIQDYQPTWHYWFAPTLMGGRDKSLSASDVHMTAAVTWEDAYVGGSCLKITGTTESEYLHLFKSDFQLVGNDKIVVKYKLLGGKGQVTLFGYGATSATNKKNNKFVERKNVIFTLDQCDAIEDASYGTDENGWQTMEWKLTNAQRLTNWMVTGLKFENAENLELLIGGLWIEKNGVTYAAPEAPQLTSSKLLANNVKGVDAKLIWNMPNSKAAGEPVYNTDVKTSMFQLWAQQEGEEPVMMGMTTSWAGIIFGAPVNNNGAKKMRFGVSALSLDTESSSAVTWSEYYSLADYQTVDDIVINKNILKPNEKFELSFVDPLHPSATWTITDESGNVKWTGSGIAVECPGVDAIGAYNLTVTYNGKTMEYPRYVAVSSEAVGALPEIYSLAIDGNSVDENSEAVQIKVNDTKEFSYTGRKADGSASRGVNLNENWFGVSCGELGLNGNKSFSIAAWVKYDELPTGRSNFITIEDRITGGWPMDNWGYFWSRINDEGRFLYDGIDSAWGWRTDGSNTEGGRIFYRYDDAKIDVGAWTHVALVFDYKANTNEMRSTFYINGKKQMVSAWLSILKSTMEDVVGSENGQWTNLEACFSKASKYGTNTYTPDYCAHNYPVTNNTWIAFGGSSQNISAVKGCVDDFQIWGKAMTEDEVRASMEGLDKNNLPADVYGYWDFEGEANSDKSFQAYVGSAAPKTSPKAYLYKIEKVNNKDTRVYDQPEYLVGSPFIAGTAYPVVTKPTWEARRAEVVGDGTGEGGSATMSWARPGDYSVRLKLANGHGEATMDYPVVKVAEETQGIDEIGVDEQGFTTYTIEDALFVEFDNDGAYNVEVYNMAGMLIGQKAVDVVAGQNVSIALGAQGVYLVKVVRDGQLLRTVKVIRK